MRFLKWALAILVVAYLAAVAGLALSERAFVFPIPAGASHPTPAAAGLPQAAEIVLTTADGERLIAWHVPPAAGKPVVIYFHGNGEVVASRVWRHRVVVADGTGLLALSYRGYMGSSGAPSEDGLAHDAEAAYDFVASRYGADRLVVWGHSLGSAVAVRLASERPIRKLILEAPFTSATDVAAARLPFIPVSLLMRDPFHSDQRIGAVTAPLLIMHGDHDEAIPVALGERLFALAHEPKRFVHFSEGRHTDLDRYGALDVVRDFLAAP